jgi:acetyl-CoA C-acetyltransferase
LRHQTSHGRASATRPDYLDGVARELGLPRDIVNVEGGAIAHGHPIGATGAVLTTRLIHSLRRDDLKRDIVTLCVGGGQGIALALETLA